MFSFPVFGSKCAPVQHMVNVLCAVLLGPWYGVGAAFVASLLRNLLGLGSLMAFPGSMCGALLCGIVYHKTHKLLPTLIGEVFGTGIIGGLLAWPVAILFMGKAAGDIAFYAYIVPFLVSTVGGSIIAGIILFALEKNGTLEIHAERSEQVTRGLYLCPYPHRWLPSGRSTRFCTAFPTLFLPTTAPTWRWPSGQAPSWPRPRRKWPTLPLWPAPLC